MQFFSSFPWMRRFTSGFALVSIALLIMVPLAACGGGSNPGTVPAASGPVNLTYWAWCGCAKMVALWNSTHPNIHVKLSNVGGGVAEYNKLFTAIKANNEPDIAMLEYQTMPTFETTNSLIDMTPYGVNSIKAQFPSWVWNQVTLGNAVYATPQDIGPMGLYYRADLFTKYHLPVPTTWAQYADDAAKLHAANPNAYISTFAANNPGWFAGQVWQAGGQLFSINGQSWKVSINNPQAQQVASLWQGLISKKLVKTEPDFSDAWYHDLQSGAVATWFTAAWGGGVIQANAPKTSGLWRVAPSPQWQTGQVVNGNWGGATNAVFKTSKHPKEATEFAMWLDTNQGSLESLIKDAGAYPASQTAATSPQLNGPQAFFGNQESWVLFKQASTQVNTNFQWGPTIEQVYNDMSNDFAPALSGQGTLNDALDKVQQSTITFMKAQGFSVST